jgi:DsbC/DsbD-like thiol-disulfide interchange protein
VISLGLGGAYVWRMKKIAPVTPVALATLALLCAAPAVAQSAPDTDGLRAVQLRSGWQTTSGTQMTALDLQLQPGWKTYWRAPGDAGIPPQFDWTGSQNIKSVKLHWPSPQVFDLNGLQSIGYHDQLVLPMEVTAKDPAQPVQVRLTVQMGICKDICLPASVTVSGEIAGKGAPDAVIRSSLAARAMTATEAGVSDLTCSVTPIDDGLRLTAQMDLPRWGKAIETVVFETTDPTIWVSQSDTQRSGGTVSGASDLVGSSGAPFALDRQGITVTVISGGSSVELRGCPAP